MGVCISLLPSFVLFEHLVLFFHIYTFILLFTNQKKKKKIMKFKAAMVGFWLAASNASSGVTSS